jgi:hypothetical protein
VCVGLVLLLWRFIHFCVFRDLVMSPPGCGGNVRFLSCADLFFSWPSLFVPKGNNKLLQFLFLFFGLLVDDGGWKRLIWKDFFLVLSCLEEREILHGWK